MKRNKKWLGKTLERVCYTSGVHQWVNFDNTYDIVITEIRGEFTATVTLNNERVDSIISPPFKTERAARKYVERELEKLFNELEDIRFRAAYEFSLTELKNPWTV